MTNGQLKKRCRIVIRCTPEQRAMIEAAAEACTRSVSTWALLALVAAAMPDKMDRETPKRGARE